MARYQGYVQVLERISGAITYDLTRIYGIAVLSRYVTKASSKRHLDE